MNCTTPPLTLISQEQQQTLAHISMIPGLFLAMSAAVKPTPTCCNKAWSDCLPGRPCGSRLECPLGSCPRWTLMVLIGSLLALLQCCCQVPQQRANSGQLICMSLDMQSKQEVTGS